MLRTDHTLPVAERTWGRYSEELVRRLRHLADTLERQPVAGAAFGDVREWVDGIVEAQSAAVTILLALEPFQPFCHPLGLDVLAQLDSALVSTADAIVDHRPVAHPVGLRLAADNWPVSGGVADSELLKEAFELEESPVDASGEFRASAVLRAYTYHRTPDLIKIVVSHLNSLGTGFTDVLAATYVVGSLTWVPDQVGAYVAMDALLGRLRAASLTVAESVVDHFDQRQRVARQVRQAVIAAWSAIPDDASEERRALALADIYRRLVEGPVRQYGWALCCLDRGEWKRPPTLAPVRDAMINVGGLARHIAEHAMLVSVRNGSAHEDLEWDGIDRVFRVDGEAVELPIVREAVRLALSFDRGCEAAVTTFKAELNVPTLSVPVAGESNRMPDVERAEALFGTNALVLLSSDLNGTTARFRLAHLDFGEINPCFQALMGARRLLPRVAAFEIRVQGRPDPILTVVAEALDQCMPVWLAALDTFDTMPVGTFLPANYATRCAVETPMRAARAAAWIAADDALDALDGSADEWRDDDVALLLDRLGLTELALVQCLGLVPEETRTRPVAVLDAVTVLRDALVSERDGRWTHDAVDTLAVVARLRHHWSVWGPVPRLPGVDNGLPPALLLERAPGRRLRAPEETWGWRTF